MHTTNARSAVRRLAAARLISVTGGAAAFAALNFTIYERTHSAAWLSASLLLTFGVSGLFAPIGGVLGDRFDRRRVMIASDLAGAACFGAMALSQDPGWLLAAGFAAAIVETPFWSASAAAIPNLVDREDLAWANGLLQVGANAGIMVGPAVGGVLLAAFGAGMVFAANAVSFVLSAVLVLTVHGRFAEDRDDDADEHHGIRAGFVFIAHDRVLRTLVVAWSVFVLGLGMVMVADVPLAELFGAGATGYGLMIGAWGAGSVIGSLAGRRLTERIEPRALVAGTIAIGVTTAGVALSPWFAPVLVLILLAGVADALIMVADRNIQQRRTPDVVRSRVVSASEAFITIALAGGFLLGGPALQLLGPRGVYAVGGVLGLFGAVVLVPMLRSSRRSQAGTLQPFAETSEVPANEPELVRTAG
jgi:ENTS family enterobactin (siderophore) exporter